MTEEAVEERAAWQAGVEGVTGVEVTVVLPTRNGAGTIRRQLDALSRQEWAGSWEVVVSDNGSTDCTVATVRDYFGRLPALKIVNSSDRLGATHARNVGVAAARGWSVVFCDDDDAVAPGWLAAFGNALREHELVAGTLEMTKLNTSWTRDPQQPDGIRQVDPPFLPYAFSAVLGIRRSLHLAIGGFNEEFVGGAEDVDYCFRAQLRGADLYYAAEAVVHYQIRSSLGAIYRQARSYSRGDVLLYTRYRPLGMRWQSPRRAAKFWALCWARLLPALASREALAIWLWHLGRRVGYLQGSVRHRVLAL